MHNHLLWYSLVALSTVTSLCNYQHHLQKAFHLAEFKHYLLSKLPALRFHTTVFFYFLSLGIWLL